MKNNRAISCYPGQLKKWVPGARVWSPSRVEIAIAKLNGKMFEHYYVVANRSIDHAMTAKRSNL